MCQVATVKRCQVLFMLFMSYIEVVETMTSYKLAYNVLASAPSFLSVSRTGNRDPAVFWGNTQNAWGNCFT